MDHNGQIATATHADSVLTWSGRVLASEHLRHRLNGYRTLHVSPRTLVTPLVLEELRARGVELIRGEPTTTDKAGTWGVAQDRSSALVRSAVQTLAHEGVPLRELPAATAAPCRWAKAIAECIAAGTCCGGVVFCDDPGLVCCVGNKLAGLRAVAVANIGQAARAALSLGPNLIAVELPGRTFFELRQILRIFCCAESGTCPGMVAATLKELETHAHR